ncbi:mitochondrial ribosomal protein L45 [Arctopsyche grandis]|uniref:mitochondrial ribosomal protein L45 n=1 Tax=Arctopsyche grandis TaxID=121162 RepID=UPI00406D7EED
MAVARLIGEIPQWILSTPTVQPLTNLILVRYRRAKHWNPKWKELRKAKVLKVNLPNFHEKKEDVSPYKMRQKMMENGLKPTRHWAERQMHISCTGTIIEPYVPPEGDGKLSVVTSAGAMQKIEYIGKKSKSMMSVRKIRSFDEDFKTSEFGDVAQDIYTKAHHYLAERNMEKLREYVTERCFPEMRNNILGKTVNWKFLNSLEPPRVVYARCCEVFTKENVFAQVTVRFHTQQQLAIYDRFGRLMHGSEILAKDVLEYVVFEKHLSNVYGIWRLHDKLIPDWMPAKEPTAKTFVKVEEQSADAAEGDTDLVSVQKSRQPLKESDQPKETA